MYETSSYTLLTSAGFVTQVALETLLSFRRAGADIILTYYAKQAAMWLQEDGL